MRKVTVLSLMILLCISLPLLAGQFGKITGRVTDAETGQPLPGVDVTVEGTMMGASTNVDGYYTILNVPPGTYTIKCSMIGYAKTTVTECES